MSVVFIDRCQVRREDWEEAQGWAIAQAKQLGLVCDKQISAITIYSSDQIWLDDKIERNADLIPERNPDLVTLAFYRHQDRHRKPVPAYLYRIEFDPGGSTGEGWPIPSAEWTMGEISGDPPETLEELIQRYGSGLPLERRARDNPAFFEIYTGIYDRLFPHLEHGDLHTDLGAYEESKKLPASHLKKEIWRTDLLTKLQALRFPPTEIEEIGFGKTGVRVIWEPQGHTNYTIWFNLVQGEDPKVNVYVDPTYSGSTTGWLSNRLIKNENGLEKLPYTIEQWAVEDLRRKTCPAYWQGIIRELLRHHTPRDMEEVWASIRRQLVGVPHGDLHTAAGEYEESFLSHLPEQFRLKG